MCCEPQGAQGAPDDVCPDCGEPTVEGETKEKCGYSTTLCPTCGWAPCDQSC